MAFNIQAAKKAGYSDQEIQSYLKGQQNQPKAGWLNPVMQLGGAVGGGILGGLGGAALGAETGPGAVIPAYLGGVAGAGAGSGVGNAGADWIRKTLLGDKSVDYNKTLPNSVEAAGQGAIGEAIGAPVAKGLGMAFHPIASIMSGDVPFVKGVDQVLSKSPKTVDMGELLGKYKSDVLPEMLKKGLSTDATQASNKLGVDITNATSAYKATPNLMDQTGLDMELPIQDANQVARNLQSSVSDFYGQPTQNADIASRKAFAGLIKDAVHTAEPTTQRADSLAHTAYNLQDVPSGLLSLLSAGNPRAARALQLIGSVPGAVTKKVVPQGGGYLNKALPLFIQAILQQSQANP